VRRDSDRFTVVWDSIDPFNPGYPHLWVKIEHLGRYLFARQLIESEHRASVIDIGCGSGYGSRILAERASRVVAVDENTDDFPAQNPGDTIQLIQYEFGSAELSELLAGEHFDAAICFELLEHVNDPESVLQSIRAMLHPGGTLLLSVPNSINEHVDEQSLLTNSLHKRAFSISSICGLLESTGFAVRHVLGQPLTADLHRNESRLIRRKQTDGRIGDEPALHSEATLRRLALVAGYPEQRDVERSYSIVLVADRS
jgi:SAM-dependent methyltransferase